MADWRRRGDDHHIDKALKFGAVRRARQPHGQHRSWRQAVAARARPPREAAKACRYPYKKELEISHTPMTAGKPKAPVENVTISIDDTPAGATLRIEWGAGARPRRLSGLVAGGWWFGGKRKITTNNQPPTAV